MDQLSVMERIKEEDNLTFVSKGHMIYKFVDLAEREQDCITILFGNLHAQHQQNILYIFETNELSIERLLR